jgi:Calcineurin-like phosphoesterase
MSEQHYDIIGDVHGHSDALRRLLVELGYGESRGAFRHDSRKAIFVGDFVDRGPDQRGVLKIARDMCEADMAKAVLGNHEFNAIAWATKDEGEPLRRHSKKNAANMRPFLISLVRGLRSIGLPSIGSGSFRCGSNSPVFGWFTHVGTSHLVPLLGPILLPGSALPTMDYEKHFVAVRKRLRLRTF